MYADAPGAAGRSVACENNTSACDRAAIHEECLAGFPASCAIWSRYDDQRDWVRHAFHLDAAGCMSDVLRECYMLLDDDIEQNRRLCELSDDCVALATVLEYKGDKIGARDALERTCQYSKSGGTDGCLRVAEKYLDNAYPEPVPGRGKALKAWACPRLKLASAFCKRP